MEEVMNIIQAMEEFYNIIEKIEEHDVQYLREFFQNYPHKINQTNTTGGTYLMAACVEGHTDLISFLIETGAELDMRNIYGRTALYHAVKNRRHDAVALLISKGAKVNIADEDGVTPLYVAVCNEDKHVVELFLNNKENTSLKVNQKDNNGWTPLHVACATGQTDIVKLLLPLPGIKINVAEKVNGFTPLHWAVEREQYDVVSFMVSQDSVELDVKDKMERTPLLLAISSGNLGIIHGLIAHGADINAVNNDGNNCLHLAVSKDRWHSEVEPISTLNEYCTKLELGEECRCTQPVVVSYLAHHGADLYCKNKKNETALDLIKNVDLREKIKSLFPPLQCMFCEVNKSMIKFHPCGHSPLCKDCCPNNPPKRCPWCKAIVTRKSEFETPKIEKKVPKVPQPTPGTSSVSQPIKTPKIEKKVPLVSQPTPSTSSISQPVESPKLHEQFLHDLAQQLTCKWQIESPESYEQFVQDLAQQLGGKLQQIETPKIEKKVPKVPQPTPSTSSVSQPIVVPKLSDKAVQTMVEPVETPKTEKKVPQPTPGTSIVSQPIVVPKLLDKAVQTMVEPVESPKLEEKHLHYVANKLGNKGPQVGRELGIQQVDLDVINYNYPNNAVEQSFQMLYKWFRSCDIEKRSIENLREALKAHDCYEALECLPSDVK